MLIQCDGLDPVAGSVPDNVRATVAAIESDQAVSELRAMKLSLLEILLSHGIATLSARADGSGDEGSLDELHCYVEASPEQYEECAVPDGVEDIVQEIITALEASDRLNFNGDGGFCEITVMTAVRDFVIECGWYYTTSESTTETETL